MPIARRHVFLPVVVVNGRRIRVRARWLGRSRWTWRRDDYTKGQDQRMVYRFWICKLFICAMVERVTQEIEVNR